MKSDGLGRTRCNQPAFRRLGNGHDPCSHVGGCVSWEDFLALSTECPVRIMKMEAFGRFIKHHFRTCQVVILSLGRRLWTWKTAAQRSHNKGSSHINETDDTCQKIFLVCVMRNDMV
ncbi:hypothetical protein FOQG_06865 [Fusarium oxysporum f. sp. raphani 54005]|uniref:Uncharacterized protein n=1 Tax=Fusarium oxysporum f. sp. raphani 54005 TaxID=1089458 RepID=X0D7U7_FUSOX|nr:hypothetical protein FOQG_06865 [Fusarium oxysporum f. sp. raphani 54005]